MSILQREVIFTNGKLKLKGRIDGNDVKKGKMDIAIIGIIFGAIIAAGLAIRAHIDGKNSSDTIDSLRKESQESTKTINSLRSESQQKSDSIIDLHKRSDRRTALLESMLHDAAKLAEERQKKLDSINEELRNNQRQTRYAIFLAKHDANIPGDLQQEGMEWLERVEKAKRSILPKKFEVIVNARAPGPYDNLIIKKLNEDGERWEIRIDPAYPNMNLWRGLTDLLLGKSAIPWQLSEQGEGPMIDQLLYNGFDPQRYIEAPEWVKDIYWEEMIYILGPYQDDYPPFPEDKTILWKKN